MNLTPKLLIVSTFAFLECSCSSYRGHKIASDGTLPANENTGVPFQMTRPEYTLNVAPSAADATVATYTLIATHVPDPDNRYTLALDPAIFADSTFLMNFGKFGNIAQNTSGISSRVAATITAVAGAATEVISALRDQSTAYDQWTKAITDSASTECKTKIDQTSSVRDVIKSDISELENMGHPATKEVGVSQVLQLYHPAKISEKNCLKSVYSELRSKNQDNLETVSKTYTEALTPTIAKTKNGTKIADFVDKHNAAGLKELVEQLTKDVATDQDAAAALGVAQKASSLLMKLQSNETTELAGTFADMSPTVWRARHLLYLERKIAEYKVNLLMVSTSDRPADSNSEKLKKATADARSLFDADKTFERLDNLNDFIAKFQITPDRNGKSTRFDADDYTKIRAERDLIETQISQLRLTIIGGNEFSSPPAKKKVTEKKGIAVVERSQEFVDKVNAKTELSEARPSYVLVLESRGAKPSPKQENVPTDPSKPGTSGSVVPESNGTKPVAKPLEAK